MREKFFHFEIEEREIKEKIQESLPLMQERLREVINEIKEKEDLPLNDEGRIEMESFAEVEGFSEKMIERDLKDVYRKEIFHLVKSAIEEIEIKESLEKKGIFKEKHFKRFEKLYQRYLEFKERREFLRQKEIEGEIVNFALERLKKLMTEEEIKRLLKEEKLKTLGEKFEMLKTIILNEVLPENFICVRTSLFDDYFHGVDNLILEKEERGDLVCVMDVTTEFSQEKVEKIKKILKKGGAKIDYGIGKEKEGLVLKKQKHLPLFIFFCKKEEIEEAILDLFSPESSLSEEEKRKVYLDFKNKFLESLSKQIESFKEFPLPSQLERKIQSFIEIMAQLKKI